MYLHSIPTGRVDPCIGVRRPPPLSSSFPPRPRPPPLLAPTLFFPRRKREEDGESFSIGCPLISSSSPPPLRHFTSAACSTSTGSGHFEGPRDEDIPRVSLSSRNSRYSRATSRPSSSCQRTHLRIISTLSRGIRPCADLFVPLRPLFLHLILFSLFLCLSSGTYFTLRRVMVYGFPFFILSLSLPSCSFHQSLPLWTPRRSYFVCDFIWFFFSRSSLVIRSCTRRKEIASLAKKTS